MICLQRNIIYPKATQNITVEHIFSHFFFSKLKCKVDITLLTADLQGYELYRQLANKKPKKKKGRGFECVDLEEEEKTRRLLSGKIYIPSLVINTY